MAMVGARGQRLQLKKMANRWTAPDDTAWYRPMLMSITPNVVMEGFDDIRTEGGNWPAQVDIGVESSGFAISGVPSFNELHIPFNSMFGTGTPAAGTIGPPDNTAAISRTWVATQYSEAPRNYYALEKGVSSYFRRFLAANVQTFTIETDRVSHSISGSGIATQMSYGLTTGFGTSTDLAKKLIDKNKYTVWSATSFANLTSAPTQLGTLADGTHNQNVYNIGITIGDMTEAVYTVDDRQVSWTDVVGGDSNMRVTLTVDANAAGESHIASARAGDTVYLKFRNQGGIIGVGTATAPYLLVMEMALQVISVDEYSTASGPFTISYTFSGTWTGSNILTIALVNAIAAD